MIVEKLPEKFEKRLADFVVTVRNLLGPNLKSIVLYGSAARGEFDPRRSDLNVLLVLEDVAYRHLAILAPYIRRWARRRIATPLVLSPGYIAGALDVYPMEFLDMQSARRVLFGEDLLEKIDPPLQSVRRQCEQESRGKLLHLREILMETGLKPRHLKQAMTLSVPAFIRIGRHVLRLQEDRPIVQSRDVIAELRKLTELSLNGLEAAWRIKTGELSPSRSELPSLLAAYLDDALAITRHVDGMKVGQGE